MGNLANKKCLPCEGGTPPLHGDAIIRLASELGDEWTVVNDHQLEREFRFEDFEDALEFTNKIGAIAEKEGHHPDIHLSWGRVKVILWTHAVNGLSENDFILAAKINRLLEQANQK
jgi:4a-hydroxytetrahydrobiopterin dehydratase